MISQKPSPARSLSRWSPPAGDRVGRFRLEGETMRVKETAAGALKVWLSARDTEQWATRPGAAWPCSELRGGSVFAEFDRQGDLVDLAINGGRGEQDCSADEFNACLTDHIASRYPDHPALRGEPQPVGG